MLKLCKVCGEYKEEKVFLKYNAISVLQIYINELLIRVDYKNLLNVLWHFLIRTSLVKHRVTS